MKLEVWHKAMELFKLVWKVVYQDNKIDFKLRAQIADATQSVSSNIAEGTVDDQLTSISNSYISPYLRFPKP